MSAQRLKSALDTWSVSVIKSTLTATTAGIAGGMTVGVGMVNLEWLAFLLAIMASSIAVSAGMAAYICREWQLKIAITPLFMSGAVYLAYTFGLTPNASVGAFCQLLDSIGIIAILAYVTWNRRKNRAIRQAKKKANQEKEAPPPQMRVVR